LDLGLGLEQLVDLALLSQIFSKDVNLVEYVVDILFKVVARGLDHALDILYIVLALPFLHLLQPLNLVLDRCEFLSSSFGLQFGTDETFFRTLFAIQFRELELVEAILQLLLHLALELVRDCCKIIIVHLFAHLLLKVVYHLVVCFLGYLGDHQLLSLIVVPLQVSLHFLHLL